jgi:Restriction endonuclease S subunits
MNYKKYKLKEIVDFIISSVDKKTIEGEKPVRLCNFVDVYYNWAISESTEKDFLAATASDKEIEKFTITKGQVAITKDSETRDDIGVSTYIAKDFDNVLLGYHCALITPYNDVLDGQYLNAFMHTSYIQKYFENNASGSGQRYTLSTDIIGNIPILLPSIEEQHKIGKIVSDIDRKIELNSSINQNLCAS